MSYSGHGHGLGIVLENLKIAIEANGGIWPTGLASQTTYDASRYMNEWNSSYLNDNGLGGGEVGWFLRKQTPFIISTANYKYSTIQLNDSGAIPFSINDGTFFISSKYDLDSKLPFFCANKFPNKVKITTCIVNAFVEATPISGPACI